MKVLYDFITMHSQNGATQYNRRVFHALMERVKKERLDVELYGLYNSKSLPGFPELSIDILTHEGIRFIDVNKGLNEINSIGFDVFFFACAQNGVWYPELKGINCKSIIVFHDCAWEELYNNDLNVYIALNGEDMFRHRGKNPIGRKVYFAIKSPTIRFCRWLLHVRQHGILEKGCEMLDTSIKLFNKRSDNMIVTVSNYSKYSLAYNLGLPVDRIRVFYSPERVYAHEKDCDNYISNIKLKKLIDEGKKYYLVVSADRIAKNAKKVLRVFERFCYKNTDAFIVTIGFKYVLFPNHVDLDFLDDYDLEIAYKNCYSLIYPSYFEGFGYPPLEAMKYGKPVLSSNVCSMPEVLGDAPIYFSPFYESGIYGALETLNENNYAEYAQKSLCRYNKVKDIQNKDLNTLVDLILS